MKKQLLLAWHFLGILMMIPVLSQASHIAGADISWKETGLDTYVISITVYRDCQGLKLNNPGASVSDCNGKAVSLTSSSLNYAMDITPVCKKSCTQCGSSPNSSPGNTSCKFQYGIEKFVYQQTIYLSSYSSSCCNFTISWSADSSRSGNITTGGSGENLYVQAMLNRCGSGVNANSSPFFTTEPLLIVPMDQCISYNPGVQDFNVDSLGRRDSLVYSLYAPMQSSSKKTTWSSPYDYNKPLKFDSFPKYNAVWNPPSCAGFHFDATNGTLNFKAKATSVTLIGIKVEAYGRDNSGKVYKKAEIRRDLSLVSIKTPTNHLPMLSGINGTGKTYINFCTGRTTCFTISTSDIETKDTVTVDTTNSLSRFGATITTQKNNPRPVAMFCWNPDSTMINSRPYQFVVVAKDDACPSNGRTYKSFLIYVRPGFKDTFGSTVLKCGDVNFFAKPKAGSAIASYFWSGDDSLYSYSSSFTQHYTKLGKHKFNLLATNGKGCSLNDTGSVNVPDFVQLNLPKDADVCKNSDVILFPLVSNGNPPYKYLWSTGDTVFKIKETITKDTFFSISVSDGKCRVTDTIHFKTFPVPTASGINIVGLDSLKASIKSAGYIWYRDGHKLLENTQEILADSPGKYEVQSVDVYGCLSALSSEYIYTSVYDGERDNLSGLRIYPNPSTGILAIEAKGIKEGHLAILNLTGQVQFQSVLNEKTALDLHSLPKGIYLLKIQNREGVMVERVVLQ